MWYFVYTTNAITTALLSIIHRYWLFEFRFPISFLWLMQKKLKKMEKLTTTNANNQQQMLDQLPGLLSGFDSKRFDSILTTIETTESTQTNYVNNELPQSTRVSYYSITNTLYSHCDTLQTIFKSSNGE